MESIKMVKMIIFAKQKQRHRCREQMYGNQGDKLGDWDWHIYTIMYKIDN